MKKNITMDDVQSHWTAIFDACFDGVRAEGTPYDAHSFDAEFGQRLACAAFEWWYFAVEAAPGTLAKFDAAIIGAAATRPGRETTGAAVDMIAAAVKALDHAAGDYRSAYVGDLRHLTHQNARQVSAPRLTLAKALLMAVPS